MMLKPCPFCGTDVSIRIIPLWEGSHGYKHCYEYDIKCEKCGCHRNLPGNNTIYWTGEQAVERAVNAWNERADKVDTP